MQRVASVSYSISLTDFCGGCTRSLSNDRKDTMEHSSLSEIDLHNHTKTHQQYIPRAGPEIEERWQGGIKIRI
jgi:hypothetical protein